MAGQRLYVLAIILFVFSSSGCGLLSGEDCPYSEESDTRLYDWGNGQALRLTKSEQAFNPHGWLVGQDDIADHFTGYSYGYFVGVMEAKFGRDGGSAGTGDYPDVAAYVRGYVAGAKDAAQITEGFSQDEKRVFGEGFGDAYVDGKHLCD